MDSPFTMENRLQIGDRIRALRQKNNFSQSYVAEKLFISQAAYSLIENSQKWDSGPAYCEFKHPL